jgi:hypothetical protein
MDLSMKEKSKVRELHGQMMAIADKYGMSMEDLVDAAVEGEEPEMEEEMGEEAPEMAEEEEKAGPDKAKIALIIGKMRRGQE